MEEASEHGKDYVGNTLSGLRLALSNVEQHHDVNGKSSVYIDENSRIIISADCGGEVVLDLSTNKIVVG